jgi:hypothetical protein
MGLSLLALPAMAVADQAETEDAQSDTDIDETFQDVDPSTNLVNVVPGPETDPETADTEEAPPVVTEPETSEAEETVPPAEEVEEAPLEEASDEPEDLDGAQSYTVSYYKDGTLLSQETVESGGVPTDIPTTDNEGNAIIGWLNASGSFVVVATAKITADTSYTAWYAPTLTSEHTRYINGTGSAKFGPNDNLTRAQAATLLYNLLDSKELGPYECSFSDVSSGSWYYTAVTTLASYKVLAGYTDGTFLPNKSMTRAEFVTMLVRMVGVQSGSLSFTDTIPSWAADYIATAVGKGWISGYEDNTFRAQSPVTRAQAVKIINRMLGRTPDESTINSGENILTYLDVTNTKLWYYYEVVEASVGHSYASTSTGETWTNYNVESCGLTAGIHLIDGTYYYVSAATNQIATLVKGVNELDGNLYMATEAGKSVYADLSTNPGYVTYMDGSKAALTNGFNEVGSMYIYWDGDTNQVKKLAAGVNLLKGAYYLANDDLYTICRDFKSISVNSSGVGVIEANGKLYITDGYLTIRTHGEAYTSATSPSSDRDLRGCTYEFNTSMYYVKSDYSLARDEWQGYLYFDKNGKYTSGDATLDAYVYNALQTGTSPEGKTVQVLNNTGLTQVGKLMYAYYYLRGGYGSSYTTSKFSYRQTSEGYTRKRYNTQEHLEWAIHTAKHMFTYQWGICYNWASAYLYMARRLGFQAYPVVGNVFSDRATSDDARHCWVMIKWNNQWHISDVEVEWGYIAKFYTGTSTYWNLFDQTVSTEWLTYYQNPECSTIRYYFKNEG